MTEGARTAVLYTKVSTKGQAEGSYRLRQQIEALRGWAGAEVYEVLLRPLGVEPYGSGRSLDDA
jgi:DNA invertase Pin-like site-specific DNA recombinase